MQGNQGFDQEDFLDLLPEIVFEIDHDLKIKFLNRTCETIIGYNREEVLNTNINLEGFVLKSDLQRIKENIKKNFNGSVINGENYKFFSKNKNIVTLEIYSSHIKKNGQIVGLRCIAIDITEKEKAHQELTSQEKHFRQIFQNFPLPYHSLNENGDFIDINPVWEKLMGYSKDEILGKNFTHILPNKYKTKFNSAFEIFKQKGEITDINFDLIKKDKSKIHVNFYGKIESDHCKFLKTHCVFTDITLQRKAEQTLIDSEVRLRELNATKDKFFSIIAHDLKNPFNDLMGFTQLLALNIEKYDLQKIEKFTKIIHQSSKLAYNLLENLLDWSRSQTGSLNYEPEKILINKLIDENIDLLESTAKNKNISIYSELDNLIYAYADTNMVRTIIRNLISNAIKYTNQGGYIKIQSYCNHDQCEISITDNGIGISKDSIDKIFKLDESYSTIGTEHEKGTGLGLILCKEFVEKNGGKLWVKSEPDKGSTFSFTLPIPEPNF